MNVLSDNDNRASSEIHLVGKKQSLKLGSKGSVAFHFNKKARLDISTIIDEDKLFELCLSAEIDDYELRTVCNGDISNPSHPNTSTLYVEVKDLAIMRDLLRTNGFLVDTSIRHYSKR